MLIYFYLIPILFSFLLAFKKLNEEQIYKISFVTTTLPFIVSLTLFAEFAFNSFKSYELALGSLHLGTHHFSFNFFFDELTFIILLLTGYLSILVVKFSRSYLHREEHYQRFFMVINMFIFGLCLLACAGTLDLFFAGWEIIGLSSFLLIGFYHDRTRPARNAYRVFSIYRLCDVGLLFTAILGHLLWKNADHFYYLINQTEGFILPIGADWTLVIQCLIIIAAIGKSGQFPFINWPARAMEGPTPSSAIFYGALSIHCGVFLLYRTYPLFEHSKTTLTIIFCIGLLSTLLATGIGRIQSNIKGQIAYASVAQIGIMFMELALGLKWLVLVHLVCHAILRCHQLLTSPSVVVDYIKSMDETNRPSLKKTIESYLPKSIKATLYTFALQEGMLSISERGFFPFPLVQLKIWGRKHFVLLTSIFLSFAVFLYYKYEGPKLEATHILAHLFAIGDLLISIICIFSLKHPKKIWLMFISAQISFILANLFHDSNNYHGILLYSVSAIPCLALGYIALNKLPPITLKKYNGLFHSHHLSYRLFMMAFIGLSGYPITSIFWAEDIIFAEILLTAPSILLMTALSLMLNGFIAGKILVKTYWGFPSETFK
jgi:NADH:ubiquinone oxidoreductase subunit 5 (subunit L)/multisubunit Na+/H+ antiporter MnhA subunit